MTQQPGPDSSRQTPRASADQKPEDPARVVVPLRRLSPLTPLARSFVFFVAVVFTSGRQLLQEREIGLVGVTILGVLLAGLAAGFTVWWRTRFRITDTELRIDTGLLSTQSRRVRLDRIVAIDINQPFAARVLGLAELKIETATTGSEAKLAFLALAEARETREMLLARSRPTPPAAEQPDSRTAGGHPVEPRPLVAVELGWHLVAILASGEVVALLLIGMVLGALAFAGAPLGAMGFGLATLGGIGLSFLRKLVGRWDWRVSAVPTGIQVRHGMFNVSTQTFDVRRLQGISVIEPLLWKPWRLAALELSIAGGIGGRGAQEDVHGLALPAAPRDLVWQLAGDLLGSDVRRVSLTPPGRRAFWLAPLSSRWMAFGLDERLLVSRTGWFARRTSGVPLARIQSLRVSRGPLQRRLGLATLTADSPDGARNLAAAHRETREARLLLEEGVQRAHAARMPRPGGVSAGSPTTSREPGPGVSPP